MTWQTADLPGIAGVQSEHLLHTASLLLRLHALELKRVERLELE